MSDRTQGSVRTDSLDGDGPAAGGAPAPEPVTSTQSIPTTGTQRVQGTGTGTQRVQTPGTGAAPVVPQPLSGTASSSAAAQAAPAQAAPAQAAPAQAAPAQAAPAQAAPAQAAPAQAAPAQGTGPISSVSGAVPAGAPRTSARPSGRGPRRARLQLRHIDTWSALKISLILSISLFFIWMVAVGLLYLVLNGLGVFDTINGLVGQLGDASGSGGGGGEVLTPGIVFGGAALIGAVNVVLLTALCTVGTFMYNLCSDLVGGLEVTLSERD